MIRYALALIAVCLFIACDQPTQQNTAGTTPAQKVTDSTHLQTTLNQRMITPGGGIGRITIGENADSVISVLGKPDKGDAGMGAQLMTWFAGHDSTGHQINIYSHRAMGTPDEGASRVKTIRVTSPAFTTSERLHTGVSFNEIKSYFHLNKTAQRKGLTYYEDSPTGIAFEVDSKNTCTAIIVFAPGNTAKTYLGMVQ